LRDFPSAGLFKALECSPVFVYMPQQNSGPEIMNPPPILKPGKSFAHQAALCSLAAPALAVLVGAAAHAISTPAAPTPRMTSIISGAICLLLIIVGFVAGIAGLCGIGKHGARGILGRSVSGLLINGLLLILFAFGFIRGFDNALKSRQFTQNLHATVLEMQANAKQSYDPKTGITNVDLNSLERIQSQLSNAAQTMSGDDALVSQVLSRYVARMQAAMKKYTGALAALNDAKVLNTENLTNKDQIASRREKVQNFIVANDKAKTVIANSEASIRADLTEQKISPQKIDQFMAGFDSKFVPRRDLDLLIRECDRRMGQSMLSVLEVLETNWGRWNYNPATARIHFDDDAARQSYQQSIAAIKLAGQEQVVAQGKLVNLP
jgi:hypothetical protein